MREQDPRVENSVRAAIAALGPAVLAIVAGSIFLDLERWKAEADALGRRANLLAIDGRFLEAELAALARDEGSDTIDIPLRDKFWDQHERMVAGTPREPLVRNEREACRAAREDRRCAESSRRLQAIEDLLEAGNLREAARMALDRPRGGTDRVGKLDGAIAAAFRARGLILLPGGDRTVGCGGDRQEARIDPLVVDSLPADRSAVEAFRLSRSGADVPQKERGGPCGDPDPATGVSFHEARSFAAASGKRLLTLAEREAVEEELRADRPPLPAGLLEWVLPERRDALGDAGYGWCYGLAGNPVVFRRKADRGHPDVTFRCALPIDDAPSR
jgi:hypothetical protein